MAVTCALRASAIPPVLDAIQDLLQNLWSRTGEVRLEDRLRFESAVVEIAANIIKHAQPADGEPTVTLHLEVECDAHALRATFHDDAQPACVDLDAVVMPDQDAEGGRGLALATAATELLGYERAGSMNRWLVECARSDRSLNTTGSNT